MWKTDLNSEELAGAASAQGGIRGRRDGVGEDGVHHLQDAEHGAVIAWRGGDLQAHRNFGVGGPDGEGASCTLT